MDQLIKVAIAELGQKEIDGPENNPTIVRYAKEAGFDWINDDETPWCSIFANWVAMKAELTGSNRLNARSWLLVGRNVDNQPEPGDVVIFWRENLSSWKGHVGFYFGHDRDGSRIYCLGGNQGDQVSISAYPAERLLGFRRLYASNFEDLSDIILKSGDTGDKVKRLQDALKTAGLNAGTSDGFYGPVTENAVRKLQSMNNGLKIDGVFGPNTYAFLKEILTES